MVTSGSLISTPDFFIHTFPFVPQKEGEKKNTLLCPGLINARIIFTSFHLMEFCFLSASLKSFGMVALSLSLSLFPPSLPHEPSLSFLPLALTFCSPALSLCPFSLQLPHFRKIHHPLPPSSPTFPLPFSLPPLPPAPFSPLSPK